jgi:hypothetical protein
MTKRNRQMYFRLKEDEYQQVLKRSKEKGFVSVSEYVRACALERELFIQEKVIDTNKKVNQIITILKNSSQP